MPLFITGQIGGTTFILSGAIILSTPGVDFPARPAMPTSPVAQISTLMPPVGYRAQEDPAALPPVLVVSLDRVSDPLGHTITLSIVNNFAPIFYTLDGTTPTEASPRYITPIRVTGTPGQDFTLKYKAFAIDGSGYAHSVVYTLALEIPQQPDLTFDITVGPLPQERTVEILSNIVGAFEIHYTLDNSIPTLVSPQYTVPFVVTESIGNSIRIKAIAFPTAPLGATGGILQSDLEDVLLMF